MSATTTASPPGGRYWSWSLFNTGLPQVSVRHLVVNQTLNTLTAATYVRGVFQLFLDHSGINVPANQPVVALSQLSGNASWVGNVQVLGDPINNTVTINVNGTQVAQNGLSNISLTIQGSVSDLIPAATNPATVIINPYAGQDGALVLSGSNTYAGLTQIENGVVIANNPYSLGGAPGSVANNSTVVGALELENDLPETVF